MSCGCGGGSNIGTPNPPCCADWPIVIDGVQQAMYFFVDNENGNDNAIGQFLAPVGTVFAAGFGASIALKTREELSRRIPRIGANRRAVVLFKPRADGGNYVNKAGTNDVGPDLNYDGYNGTGTIIQRASDLTNSVNDRVDLAGVIGEVGPNVDGSWTATGAMGGTFGNAVTVAAGAFSAINTVTGLKFQFKGNITAGARIRGGVVNDRTAANVVNSGVVVTIANGDEFFLMTPAVKFTAPIGMSGRNGFDNANTQTVRGGIVAGFRWTSAVTHTLMGAIFFAFCRFDSSYTADWLKAKVGVNPSYPDETGTLILTNCGLDIRGNGSVNFDEGNLSYSAWHGTSTIAARGTFPLGSGSYFNAAPNIQNARGCFFGGFAGVGPARCPAGVITDSSLSAFSMGNMLLGTVDVSGAGTGLTVRGQSAVIHTGSLSGACTVSALDCSACANTNLNVPATTTATGATQDVLMAGGIVATIASLAVSPQYDAQGNIVQGTAGVPMRKAIKFMSGVFVGAAGPVTNYLADVGPNAAGVLVAPVSYVPPAGRCRNLKMKATVNPLPGGTVIRVLKNGGATGITVTILAGSVAVFSDTTNEAQFNGTTDTFDVDMTETGVGTMELSGTLEWY